MTTAFMEKNSIYTREFECCLENGLKHIETFANSNELLDAIIHCNKHLNETIRGIEFLKHVFRFSMLMENVTTADCNLPVDLCARNIKGWYNAYVVFWIVALVVGLIGNTLVLGTFFQAAELRKKVANYFVTSLAASDLFVVFFIVPLKIYTALHNHNFCASVSVCRLYFTTDVTFFAASITNIFAITIDRYFAVTNPYNYQEIVTAQRARLVILFIWINATLWGLMVNFNGKTNAFDAVELHQNVCSVNNIIYFCILYAIVFFVPSLIMLAVYGKILKIALSHAKTMDTRRVHLKASENRRRSSIALFTQSNFFTNRKLEFRATKVVLVVYGTFIVCWLPIVSITVASYIIPNFKHSQIVYVIFGEMLPVINSILNPFIYGILHRDFKHGIKRILGILYLQHHIGRGRNQKKSTFDLTTYRQRTSTYLTISHNLETRSPSPTTARSGMLDTTQESNISTNELDTTNTDKKYSLTDSERTCSSDEQNPLMKAK